MLISNLTYPNCYILLQLAKESYGYYWLYIISTVKFSKQTLLIMDLVVPVSQSIEIFFLLITVLKSAVCMLYM